MYGTWKNVAERLRDNHRRSGIPAGQSLAYRTATEADRIAAANRTTWDVVTIVIGFCFKFVFAIALFGLVVQAIHLAASFLARILAALGA